MFRRVLFLFILAAMLFAAAGSASAQGITAMPEITATSSTRFDFNLPLRQIQDLSTRGGDKLFPSRWHKSPASNGRCCTGPASWIYDIQANAIASNGASLTCGTNKPGYTTHDESDHGHHSSRAGFCSGLRPGTTYTLSVRVHGRTAQGSQTDTYRVQEGYQVYVDYPTVQVRTASASNAARPGAISGLQAIAGTTDSDRSAICAVFQRASNAAYYEINLYVSSEGNSNLWRGLLNDAKGADTCSNHKATDDSTFHIHEDYLLDNTQYVLQVRAVSADNLAGPIATTQVRTGKYEYNPAPFPGKGTSSSNPQAAGNALEVSNITHNSFKVSWPNHNRNEDYANGISRTTSYRARLMNAMGFIGGWTTQNKSYTFTGLEPDTAYVVEIWAVGKDMTFFTSSGQKTVTTEAAPQPRSSSSPQQSEPQGSPQQSQPQGNSQGSPGDQDPNNQGGVSAGTGGSNSQPQGQPQGSPQQSEPQQSQPSYTVPNSLIQTVRGYYNDNVAAGRTGNNWLQVLIAFGVETHDSLAPMTAAEARERVSRWSGWRPIAEALEKLEG